MKRNLILSGVLGLTLMFAGTEPGTAGTTGKIHGYVRDDRGAPLQGVNVLLDGLKQGAITDGGGYYAILNVTPGIYRLRASLIGHERVTRVPVGVIADQTTPVDFTLREAAIQISEMTVVAEPPPVEADKTTSKHVITATDVERIGGTRTVQDFLQLQPGVHIDGSNRLRASLSEGHGYGNDVAYILDGLRMNYNDGRGKGGAFQTVNRGAVQEMAILTGVLPAEYGNTQGGVVNIITKEGGSRLHGWTEGRFEPGSQKHWGANVYDAPQHLGKARWDDPKWANERNPKTGELVHQRTDYTRWQGWQVEGNASGPLGGVASWVATARHERIASPLPGPTRTGFYDERNRFVHSGPNNLVMSGSVTSNLSPNMKLKVGGLFQGWRYYSNGVDDVYQSGPTSLLYILPGVVRGMGDEGRDLFLPENWSAAGRQIARESLAYAVWTHTLSPRTFYEIRISRSQSRMDTSGASYTTQINVKDSAGWFSLGRPSAARWRLYDRQRYTFRADASSQVARSHFLKVGLELIRGSAWLTQMVNSDPLERRIYLYADRLEMGKPVHPIFLSAYAQDKMEYRGLIVNLGLRMDTFCANERTQQHGAYSGAPMFRSFTRARDYLYDEQSIWSIPSPWHISFSPRIGVSHPITSRAQVRFSAGVFYQHADLFWIYGKDFRASTVPGPAALRMDKDINRNGKIDPTELYNALETTYNGYNGTVLLRPAKTTNFEVGMDWNFLRDYTASLGTFYKSAVDQFVYYPNENWLGPSDRQMLYSRTLDNGGYADTRGVELSLKKGLGSHFSLQSSLTFQWSRFTSGKLGNVIRNVYLDSMAVATLAKSGYTKTFPDGQQVYVPDLWIDIDSTTTGREIPRPMSAGDIGKYGKQAQGYLNDALQMNPSTSSGTFVYDPVYPMAGEIGGKGVYTRTAGSVTDNRMPAGGEHRCFGSLTLLLSLPDNLRFGPPYLSALFRNLRTTVITRFESGMLAQYTTSYDWREMPMDSRTDLTLEKMFRPDGRFHPTLFVDIRNLFNQKDRVSITPVLDYLDYGLQDPRPDNLNFRNYGDVNDRNYAHYPRRWSLGMRFNW